jgi:hypothetical protein
LDEIQFVIDDDNEIGGRRHSLGQLSGIFTLTNNFKRVPSIMQNETNRVNILTQRRKLVF